MEWIKPWADPFEPFRIFGNLYFAGTVPTSVHVLDTGDGLIVFDTGYQASLYLIVDSIHRLGLDPRAIRYIFLTHGHIDHLGGARSLKELSGAEIALGAEDREYANGTLDLTYAAELGLSYRETFEPDILLRDGDVISLGNTTVRALATPGHTPGAMSYLFPVSDGERTVIAGLHGGSGLNTMCRSFLRKYGLSDSCREQFKQSADRLATERVDLFLGNHMCQNDTAGKYKRLCGGDREAFIDPTEWATFLRRSKQDLIRMEEKENHES